MQTTTNIGLKTYEANDPTDWLGEFNYNMNKIDTAIGSQNDAIDVIEETAGTAVTTANTANDTATEALTTAESKTSVNDNVASATTTYSSNKINELISGAGGAVIDDTETSTTKTWSSSKINTEVSTKASINDTTAGSTTTYSSNKINSLLGASAIDFSSKTVVATGTVENTRLAVDYTVASDGYYMFDFILHSAYVYMSIGGSSALGGVMVGSGSEPSGESKPAVSPIYYLKAGQTMHALAYLDVSGDTNNSGKILKFNPL